MNFEEALQELKELAGEDGTYMLEYRKGSYINGCAIHGYIAEIGHAKEACTYQEAIDNIKVMLGIIKHDRAPDDGAGEGGESEKEG